MVRRKVADPFLFLLRSGGKAMTGSILGPGTSGEGRKEHDYSGSCCWYEGRRGQNSSWIPLLEGAKKDVRVHPGS